MRLKKSVAVCLVIFMLILMISGCGSDQSKQKIYDDDAFIVRQGDSCSYFSKVISENSKEHFDYTFNSFSGSDTIWTIQSKAGGTITFKFDSEIDKGDFKAVLIDPQKEIEILFEGSQKGDKTVDLAEGKYVVKLVGRNAKGGVDISITNSQNVQIQKNET